MLVGDVRMLCKSIYESNEMFVCVVTRLSINSQRLRAETVLIYNNKRVFGCAVNDFSALILAYFVINYKFKGISVIT